MTIAEIKMRSRIKRYRLEFQAALNAGDTVAAIRAAKMVDRSERELAKYLGVEAVEEGK